MCSVSDRQCVRSIRPTEDLAGHGACARHTYELAHGEVLRGPMYRCPLCIGGRRASASRDIGCEQRTKKKKKKKKQKKRKNRHNGIEKRDGNSPPSDDLTGLCGSVWRLCLSNPVRPTEQDRHQSFQAPNWIWHRDAGQRAPALSVVVVIPWHAPALSGECSI